MATDQTGPAERAHGIAGALAEVDPNTLQIRTEKLDGFLNGVMLPFIGLHIAMIGTLILGADSLDEYRSMGPIFLLIGLGIASIAWLRWRTDGGKVPRQAPSAAFCFLLAAAATLPSVPLAGVLIGLMYGALLWLAYRKRFSSIELVFPSIYIAAFAVAFWRDDFELAVLLFAACILLGGVTIWRLGKMQHAVGLLIGAAVLLVSKIEANVSDEGAIATVCIMFGIAGVVYELLIGGRQFSNLRHFLSQGVVVLLFLVIVGVVSPKIDETSIWIWTAIVIVYSAAMASARPNEGTAIRAGWSAIAILSAILTKYESGADGGVATWIPMVASLALVIGLAYSAKRMHSAFIHNLSQLLLVVLCLVIFNHISRIDDAVLPSSILTPSMDQDPAARDPAALSAQALQIKNLAIDNRLAIAGAGCLILLAYLTGYITTLAYAYPRGIPWWRGLIRPRHAVIVRRLFRATTEQVQGLPFVGAFLTAILVVIRSLRYLKGGGNQISFGDLVDVALNIFVALSGATLLKLWLIPHFPDETAEAAITDAYRAGFVAAWVGWGILLYLRGVWFDRVQLIFLGVGFVIVPPVKFIAVEDFPKTPFLAAILITSGLALCLFGLVRRAERGHRPVRRA